MVERLVSLPRALSSPAVARSAMREVLAPTRTPEEQVAAAQLVVSELVANAVHHGDSEVDLRLEVELGRVRIEVTDYGDGVPTVLSPGPDADRGRGLCLVEALARRWGVVREDGWKV